MKINGALIAAFIACAVLWIEHGHDINIDAPTDATAATANAVCPDNDSFPYGAKCLAFLGAGDVPERRRRVSDPSGHADLEHVPSARDCPVNDNRPYTPSCIRFISGWFWQPN